MWATMLFSSLCGFLFSFILTNYHRYKLKLLELRARQDVARAQQKELASATWELALLTHRLAYVVIMLAIPGLLLALSEDSLAQYVLLLAPFSLTAWVSWPLCWKVFLLENLLDPWTDNVLLADEMTKEQKEKLMEALDELSLAIEGFNRERAKEALRKVVSLVFR